VNIELELTEQYKENIELWDWKNYNKFTPLYNAPIEPTNIKKVK